MPRPRDIARKEVRVDMASISAADASQLLAQFGPLVRRIAGDFPTVDSDELEAVGRIAIMEAWVTHKPQRIPLRQWVRRVVRWRIVELADGEMSQQYFSPLDLVSGTVGEPMTNGRHDPERRFMLEQIIELVPYLPPRQAMIIDGRLRRETYEEIGRSLGISAQWCHQEYMSALAQLREWVVFGIS